MSDAALELLGLLKPLGHRVWRASNGRWYVTERAGQVKQAAVQELIDAGLVVPGDEKGSYRRAA